MSNHLENDGYRQFLVVAHAYQPPRQVYLPNHGQMDVLSGTNEEIYQKCYRPLLVDSAPFPGGFVFSFYNSIRQWMIKEHPEGFSRVKEKANEMKDKECSVLSDPFNHSILPLQSEQNQMMYMEMGRKAFIDDFGFEPKGVWLPEAAVATHTLGVAADIGYEFVVLRDSQIKSREKNPMYVKLGKGKEIAVFHFDTALSQEVSFNGWSTVSADNFLNSWIPGFVPRDKTFVGVGTDMELYGSHRSGPVQWLDYLLKPETLTRHGFVPLSIKDRLENTEKSYTEVKDLSSWSCDHSLGRWTGDCECDSPDVSTTISKQSLFGSLSYSNCLVDGELDRIDSLWRREYSDVVVGLRNKIFTGQDFLSEMEKIISVEKLRLFLAKNYLTLALTSCAWFFGNGDSPERQIAEIMGKAAWEIMERPKRPAVQTYGLETDLTPAVAA